ncbi:flagellar hook-associated protein FlgL [Marinobacterium sediminicola]|uniref:Flagellar hook-associated protein 3 n=1 Tax=Marinobacterium sediminicola TaxID=518898 RepID=A0ABY1RYD0_9GAMM|nr:flagellar hook-associated protein FlgL [Marinobacterium sediminicola]ULG68792.1 flagellar hook-associated protein FlgL [Marinobacterium sediminicola]SMR73322.1 flagellar hook-associated protein 3 [Marinobacterium sediminicola]
MRISTGQIFANANRNMMENQTSLLEIQDKLSSGKKFTSLAEDPVGANRVVSLKRELAQLDMFQGNIDASRRRLELEDATFADLNTAMDRMRELSLQARNNTNTDADRQAIAYELEQLVEYSAGLMNTRDAKGEYIFSGSKGTTQTYIKQDDRYYYQGDSTARNIQISSALYTQSTDAGRDLFESISQAPELSVSGEMAVAITGYEVTDPALYAGLMRSTGDLELRVTVGTDGALPPSVPAPEYRYSLLDSAGRPVRTAPPENTPIQDIVFDPADPDERQVSLNLAGITLDLTLPDNTFVDDTAVQVSGEGEAYFANTAGNPTLSDSQVFTDLISANGPLTVKVAYDPAAVGSEYTYTVENAAGDPVAVPGLTPNDDLIELDGWRVQMQGGSDPYSTAFTLALEPPQAARLRFEQPPSNVLNAVMETVEALREPVQGDQEALTLQNERIDQALNEIKASQERIGESISKVGSRLRTLEKAEFTNTDFKLMTEGTLSAVQDLDYAEASTDLAKRQLALEAAYASFSKIQNLSLFDYIR